MGNATEVGTLGEIAGYNLRRAELAMADVFRGVALPFELTPAQFSVLMLIDANPGIKQTTLASFLGVERSTMGRIVDRCEAAKLVRRGSSPSDQRIAPPCLTARGRAALRAIVPALFRSEREFFGRTLTPAEATTLLRLLRKVNAASVPRRRIDGSSTRAC